MSRIHLIVRFDLVAGASEAFLPLIQENRRASLEEPGCHQFEVLQPQEGGSDVIILYEIYTDSAALTAHGTMDHVKQFFGKAKPYLAKVDIQQLVDAA